MKKAYYLVLICFLPILSFGQASVDEETGNKYFDLFDYETAIKHYKKTTKLTLQGKRNLEASYKRTERFVECEAVAKEIVNLPEHNSNDVFNYVSILRMNKKYEESEAWMKEYESLVGSDQRILANRFTQSRINDLLVDQGNMNVMNLGFNSENQEFAPMYFGDKLVYTAAGMTSEPENQVNNITKQNFLRLYVLDTNDLNSMRRTYFNNQLMGKYNEGVACFSKDQNLMFFSGNDVTEAEKNQKINVQLYYVKRDSLGSWGSPMPFPYNDRRFSFGHPYLSEDGKTLFFSSNKEGSLGGSDIWKCTLNGDTWSEPMNLGNHVNTESNEFYPFFISKTNSLFFASEGRGGLGGLDVFVIEMKDNNFDFAQNLGAPLNSSFDDFSFVSNDDCSEGYFASNRQGGKGGDDVYRFAITHNWEIPKSYRTIGGRVTDENGNAIANAVIYIHDTKDSLMSSVVSDDRGYYETKFEHGEEDSIQTKSIFGVIQKSIVFETDSTYAEYNFIFKIPKKLKDLSDYKRKGNSVYFHTAKWDLTTNGKLTLDYYAKCLLEDATLKVEINAFADMRSTVELNTYLSKMRMESARNYLLSKGVPASQLIGNYYGATTTGVDLNDQKCECTETKLELCRRADMKLLRE